MSETIYPCDLATVYPFAGGPFNASTHAVVTRWERVDFAMGLTYESAARAMAARLSGLYPAAAFRVLNMDSPVVRRLQIGGAAFGFYEAFGCEWREICLPFSGFYYSQHDDSFDRALESDFSDDQGNPHPDLLAIAQNGIDFRLSRHAYASEYASDYADSCNLLSGRFTAMESPREYNFETDRVFASFTAQEVFAMFATVDESDRGRETLARIAAERHTSRSGFSSFYSPGVAEWGDVADWDLNQLGTLIRAFREIETGQEWDSEQESELVESYDCNGLLSGWLSAAMNAAALRAGNLCGYLRTRAERGEPKAQAAFSAC